MSTDTPRPTPGPPVVDLKAWTATEALVIVNGTRVRVRRNRTGARWICDEHGSDTAPHCHHTEAAAAAPANPKKRTSR